MVVRLGQPMAFTLTLSNKSNRTVDVSPKEKTGSVTIYYGSQGVLRSRKLTLQGHKTIAAGHSVQLRGVWSGNGSKDVKSRLAARDVHDRGLVRRLLGVGDDPG